MSDLLIRNITSIPPGCVLNECVIHNSICSQGIQYLPISAKVIYAKPIWVVSVNPTDMLTLVWSGRIEIEVKL